MQAIQTKYLPATNTRGGRIKVMTWLGTKIYAYNHSADCAHECAFKQWLQEVNAERTQAGYTGAVPFYQVLAKGVNPDNSGYTFIVQ